MGKFIKLKDKYPNKGVLVDFNKKLTIIKINEHIKKIYRRNEKNE